MPVQQLSPHWRNILNVFDALLETLKENNVPQFLVKKLFQQLFSFVNVQLFNQLLLRRECCSFNNGEYVKTGLAEVEGWIQDAGKDWVGESWDELRYIRQVYCLYTLLYITSTVPHDSVVVSVRHMVLDCPDLHPVFVNALHGVFGGLLSTHLSVKVMLSGVRLSYTAPVASSSGGKGE